MAKKKPLYEITQHITFRDYLKYCRSSGTRPGNRTLDLILALVMFAGAFAGWYINKGIIMVFGISAGILFLFMALFLWYFEALRMYRTNKMLSTGTRRITFYEDSFSVRWKQEKGECSYRRLKEIAEDENAFYLMVEKGSGEIILKRCCSKELSEFLQEKKNQQSAA